MTMLDNRQLMLKICRMYYLANISQKEISEKLGISRAQVCRIISAAREKGIVTITIDDAFETELNLEQGLIKKFSLKDAIVVNLSGYPSDQTFEKFCMQAAEHIETLINDGMKIGVMSGNTISTVIDYVSPSQKKNLEIVPLMGGLGLENAKIHANAIAQRFAEKTGGINYALNAPVIVQSAEIKESLLREPTIRSILKLGRNCDIALLGIGNVNVSSTPAIAGRWTEKDRKELLNRGVIAAICNSFLDKDGKIIETILDKRSIGQTLQTLSSAKKIGIGVGIAKTEAIKASLSSGYLDVLITDTDTAARLLN